MALCCLFFLAACGVSAGGGPAPASQPDEDRLSVVTTIFPQYDFVRQIAGEAVSLTMLLPPGAESHSFEPTPQDIITIQNCNVFIYVGGDSDAWIEDILASMDTGAMELLSLLDMVEAKEEELVEGMEHDHADHDHEDHDHAGETGDHQHEEDHHQAPELDEHVWTSPKNAMLMVEALAETLCQLDAGNAEIYRQNADAYLEKLAALDAGFEAAVAGGARKTLVFGDRFPFRYLADAYGLSYWAAFPGCSTETEPSAATVAFLIDKVKAEGIPVVFHIELSNEKMADTICADTGAKKLQMHSCHNLTKAELEAGADYLSLMEQNLNALKEALA